jgi:hypothetical protein
LDEKGLGACPHLNPPLNIAILEYGVCTVEPMNKAKTFNVTVVKPLMIFIYCSMPEKLIKLVM